MTRLSKLEDSYVMDPGLHHLHRAGWVHRDFNPGNVIVVGTKAMISDLEFAKRRLAEQLEELTRPKNTSLPGVKELRTVGLSLVRVHELKRSSSGNSIFHSHRDPGRGILVPSATWDRLEEWRSSSNRTLFEMGQSNPPPR